MVTLTLPCPLWEGAFGTSRDASCASGGSLANPPALLKVAPEPSQPWLRRGTLAHASAHCPSNLNMVATDTLSTDDSLELRRAGAELDFTRAAFDNDLSLRRRYRYPSGRDSFDDLSTILTTSRSEYGASASASSWSSRSYTSNAGSSYESCGESSNAGPGPSWIRRTRTPSPEMGSAVALEAYETPPRRLRMSARHPSPHGDFAGRRLQVTRLPLSTVQVSGAGEQGLSKSWQSAAELLYDDDTHLSTQIGDSLLRSASRGHQPLGFSRRLPPPRPVSLDVPLEMAGTSHCSSAGVGRSASCEPRGRQRAESQSDDSWEEQYIGRSQSIDHLLEVCRHLRENGPRSGSSISCASDANSTTANYAEGHADYKTSNLEAKVDGTIEHPQSLQKGLPMKASATDDETVMQIQSEQEMIIEDATTVSASHSILVGPTMHYAENACSSVYQEAPDEMSSSKGPPSTVRSCCSAPDILSAGPPSSVRSIGSSQDIPSNDTSRSLPRGDESTFAELRPPGSKAASALRDFPQELAPVAADVPLPLSVACAASSTPPAKEFGDEDSAHQTMEDVSSVAIESHAEDCEAFSEKTSTHTTQPDGEELPIFLWVASNKEKAAVSLYSAEEAAPVQKLVQPTVEAIGSVKLQKDHLPTSRGVVAAGCESNTEGATRGGRPQRSTARLPNPPRSLRFKRHSEYGVHMKRHRSVQDCHVAAEGPFLDPWCTFAEDAVHALQLSKKGCRRASSLALEKQNRCRVGRRRHSGRFSSGGQTEETPSAAAPVVSEIAAPTAEWHSRRSQTRTWNQDGNSSTAPARRARSYLNRRDVKNLVTSQSQEVLQAGQLKTLQRTRSQLKEEQRLAAEKVEELQQGFCRLTAVPDTDTLFTEVSQMLRTQGLPNLEIKSISRTVMNEKYAQAYLKNRGSKAERVLWLASPAVDARQILESQHCLDYRHASFGQLGRGIYGADLAVYADTFCAHETESGAKQLLLYKGIVGRSLPCFVGPSENVCSSLMLSAAPPGHDSTCAPGAALCKACTGTQPGCILAERCTCPFMPVGYQSEYGKQMKRRVSSPLYCLLPPAGHIQDQLLMEPSDLEPYVLAIPLALVEYVNLEPKACSVLEPKWWHPDVAHVLERYCKALADDRVRREAVLESAVAHRELLEARTAEAELDLAVEREDKVQLEKTIKALQSERDRLQTALKSTASSQECKFTGTSGRDGFFPSQLSVASSAPSLSAGLAPTAAISPTSASGNALRDCSAPGPSRSRALPTLSRSGSLARSEDSDHPEEYWEEAFSEMPEPDADDGEESRVLTSDEHTGKNASLMAQHGVASAMAQHGALRQQRVGLDFRSGTNASAFIKTVKESAVTAVASPKGSPGLSEASPGTPESGRSLTARKSSAWQRQLMDMGKAKNICKLFQEQNRAHVLRNAPPFAPSTLRQTVVLGDPIESELIETPELIEICLHARPCVSTTNVCSKSAHYGAHVSSAEPDAQVVMHATSNVSSRQEVTPPRRSHVQKEKGAHWNALQSRARAVSVCNSTLRSNSKTSRAAIDVVSGNATRQESTSRRRRVKFRDEMDALEPSPARKTMQSAVEDVKSILKFKNEAMWGLSKSM